MPLEDTLARAFDTAGERAPAPPPDFVGGVLARQRQRQRMRAVRVTGTLTVSLAAVAGASLVLARGRRADAPVTRLRYGPPLDLTRARPAEEVWPEAVDRLRPTLSQFRDYRPMHWLDRHRLLVEPTGRPSEEPRTLQLAPAIIDTGGDVMVFAPSSGSRRPPLDGVAFDARRVVFVVATHYVDGTYAFEVYSYPVAGGMPKPLGQLAHSDPEWTVERCVPIVLHDEAGLALRTRANATGQVRSRFYRASDRGGVTSVDGADGYWPHGAPWVEKLGDGVPTFWNVETGERRTPVRPAGLRPLKWGPEWCVGQDGGTLVAFRFDGSRAIAVRGAATAYLPTQWTPDTPGERFFAIRDPAGRGYLWDLERHRVAAISGWAPAYSTVLLSADATSKLVLDLDRLA